MMLYSTRNFPYLLSAKLMASNFVGFAFAFSHQGALRSTKQQDVAFNGSQGKIPEESSIKMRVLLFERFLQV